MPVRAALSVARMITLAHGTLGWAWVVSFAATLLCALPWFEFANPNHIWPTVTTAALLTLTGFGPAYFAARTASDWVRRTLDQITPKSWVIVKLLIKLAVGLGLLTVLASCVVGWYALAPWGALLGLFPDRRGKFQTELMPFRRGGASIQLRPTTNGQYKPVIVRALLPGINFRTDLPADQPDSTWAASYPPLLAPDYVHFETLRWQLWLLGRAANPQRLEAAKAAQQQHVNAMQAARGMNRLRLTFASTAEPVPTGHREACRMRSLSTDDSVSHLSYYAQLTQDHVFLLRVLVTNDTNSETFYLALPGFRGTGRYELSGIQAENSSAPIGPGYVNFTRHFNGVSANYLSIPAAPCQLIITRYNAAQHIVSGKFSGLLRTLDGRQTSLTDGFFETDFKLVPAGQQ